MRNERDILKKLLENRGITSPEDIREFYSDSPTRTYDPFEMRNMREGVDLVLKTVESGGRICIYGDYDSDGVTSICTLYQGLKHLTDNISWYIPSRFDEGYGMNVEAVEKLAEDNVDLIITVDCGISSIEEVNRAHELGMEVLVTDHHTPGESLPDCLVIDPKQKDETYPYRDLAGCGVAFKLLQGIQRAADLPKKVVADSLDLVGAGTVGDIVPLTDENRTIVKYGLKKLNEGKRRSIRALADAISIREITSERISFGIVPHINASGRMGSAGEAVELFLSDDPTTIDTQVGKIVSYNRERRKVQEEAYEKCLTRIDGNEEIVFIRVEGIHEGIAGIVAGNIKELMKRPVILTTPIGDGLLKGTGRSISGLDIFRILSNHRESFVKFGGHSRACGFTMKDDDFDSLKSAVEEDVHNLFREEPGILDPGLEYDMKIEPEEITLKLADALEAMEPFGEGNPPPVFLLTSVVPRSPRYMGSEENHVRFSIEVGDGKWIHCVLFRHAKEYSSLVEGQMPVNITGQIKANEWNGERRLQFIIEEIESGE